MFDKGFQPRGKPQGYLVYSRYGYLADRLDRACYKTSAEATAEYINYAEKLKKLIPFGYSGAVYTQTTDVEIEVNGLLTYDRKVIKLDEAKIRKVNSEICNFLSK